MREDRTFGNRTKIRISDEVNRKCFFFCEGQETEPIYFAKLKELKIEIGISPLIDFIQIEKPRGEDWSNPKKMLDALCLDLSKEITYCIMLCGSDFCIFFQKIQKFKKSLDEY